LSIADAYWSGDMIVTGSIKVRFIRQSTHFGAVRLYNMRKFTSSQLQMDVSLFDNTIDEDQNFKPVVVD